MLSNGTRPTRSSYLMRPSTQERRRDAEVTHERPRIAVFAGATATVLATNPLLTSEKAYARYGLDSHGAPVPHGLRPQRLAAPAKVYIEQFSAHPLESDVAELYGPPDGYVHADGTFSAMRQTPDAVAAYEVTLDPSDGLYLLPYMARQADGTAWQGDGVAEGAPPDKSRQGFLPDASRLIEEIDRFEVEESGYEPGLAAPCRFRVLSSRARQAATPRACRSAHGRTAATMTSLLSRSDATSFRTARHGLSRLPRSSPISPTSFRTSFVGTVRWRHLARGQPVRRRDRVLVAPAAWTSMFHSCARRAASDRRVDATSSTRSPTLSPGSLLTKMVATAWASSP